MSGHRTISSDKTIGGLKFCVDWWFLARKAIILNVRKHAREIY